MNYVSRFRSLDLHNQFYNFLLSLTGSLNPRSVLVVSVPASELEMTAADVSDYQRITKELDRVGKAMTMTAGAETSEIIRRRLFEWDTPRPEWRRQGHASDRSRGRLPRVRPVGE